MTKLITPGNHQHQHHGPQHKQFIGQDEALPPYNNKYSFKIVCKQIKPLFVCFQAALEMAAEEAAVTMVNYYASAPPTIRNQPVFLQYSTHRELKTDNLTNQVIRSSLESA